MDAITRMAVEAAALSVFIAVGSWGLVRASVVALAAGRYFQLRSERYPATADLPRPRVFARTQVILSAGICWAAMAVFIAVRVTGAWPTTVWIAVAAAGPVAAAVALLVSSRSPWAKVRSLISASGRVPVDRRDEVLFGAFAVDPQLKETGDARF